MGWDEGPFPPLSSVPGPPSREAPSGAPEAAPLQQQQAPQWAPPSWAEYTNFLTAVTGGGVTVCDANRRILWACPKATAALSLPSRLSPRGPPGGSLLGSSSQMCSPVGPPGGALKEPHAEGDMEEGDSGLGLCEDLVNPDDRVALLRAFELAAEQQQEASRKEECVHNKDIYNSSNEKRCINNSKNAHKGVRVQAYGVYSFSPDSDEIEKPPSVLVRLGAPAEGPPNPSSGDPEGQERLFQVSVTQCGAHPTLFACLWKDATKLRKSAALQEALVCGLSDCMDIAVWVFNSLTANEDNNNDNNTNDEDVENGENLMDLFTSLGYQESPTQDKIDDDAEAAATTEHSSEEAPTLGGPPDQETPWGLGTPRQLGDPLSCSTSIVPTQSCLASPVQSAASVSSKQIEHTLLSSLETATGGHSACEASQSPLSAFKQKQQHPCPHSFAAFSSPGSYALSDTNVAPASFRPTVYQTKERAFYPKQLKSPPGAPLRGPCGPGAPLEAPRHAGAPNKLRGNDRQSTVAGGPPLLQIERIGRLGFVLEHSRSVLERLTGRTVQGRELFSTMDAGEEGAPFSKESSWTDFFLEPGKTQLMKCVKKLKESGKSFSVEVPYERSDGIIRWFKVAGYCSSMVSGVMWGMMQDVTASRTRLGCAQKSLHQLKTLFEAEFCGMGIVDTADTGLIVETSPGLDAFLGASAVGRPSVCLLPEPVKKLTLLKGSCVGAPIIIQEREFSKAALHQVTVTAVLDNESPGEMLFALRDDRRKHSILCLQQLIHSMQS